MHEAEYFVHCNYARPFRVVIVGNGVRVYRMAETDDLAAPVTYDEDPCLVVEARKIFRGDSLVANATTEFGAGVGPQLDGNTFLFCVGSPLDVASDSEADIGEASDADSCPDPDTWTYVHVGRTVRRFVTDYEITHYYSPVGINDYPYSYAVDVGGCVLLLSYEHIKFTPGPEQLAEYKAGLGDPYTDYWALSRLTPEAFDAPGPVFAGFRGAVTWRLGGSVSGLKYHPDAPSRYDCLAADYGTMELEYEDGTTTVLDKAGYVDLLEAFGEHVGIVPLETTVVAPGFLPGVGWA